MNAILALKRRVSAPARLAIRRYSAAAAKHSWSETERAIAELKVALLQLGYEEASTGVEKWGVYLANDHVLKFGPAAEREAICYKLTPRSRTIARTARLGCCAAVQERGEVLGRIKYTDPRRARLYQGEWPKRPIDRFRQRCCNLGFTDEHDHNIALIDDQLRLIDFGIGSHRYIQRHSPQKAVA